MDQDNTPARKTLWIFAVIGVLLYALVPVIWIASLSLKTPRVDR
jgi:ABC-type glycerol-3-phosphate transport system permease component